MPRATFAIIGHRGNGAGPGENTVASCRAAVRAGADELELDVQLFGDRLLLAHPPAAAKNSLADVTRTLGVPLVLHLKRRCLSRKHDRAVIDRLAKLRYKPGFVVSTFWPGTLRYAKRHHPDLRTAFATWWLWWDRHFGRSLGVSEFHTWYRTLTPPVARRTRTAGYRIVAFVPNDPDWQPREVDAVMTDRIRDFVRLRRRLTGAGRVPRH